MNSEPELKDWYMNDTSVCGWILKRILVILET